MENNRYDLIVIGAAPPGWRRRGRAQGGARRILLLERDNELGGILNQCIHNGFGLHHFKEELTGPEYAGRFIELVRKTNVEVQTGHDGAGRAGPERRVAHRAMRSTGTATGAGDRAVVLCHGLPRAHARRHFHPGRAPGGVFTAGAAQRLPEHGGLHGGPPRGDSGLAATSA